MNFMNRPACFASVRSPRLWAPLPRALLLGLTVAGATCAVQPAYSSNLGIAATAGTTGLGLHVSKGLGNGLGLRVGGNFFSKTTHAESPRVAYSVGLKLATADLLVDYFPLRGDFRLTSGIVWNGSLVRAVGLPLDNSTIRVRGVSFPAASLGEHHINMRYRRFAPYVGLGWGSAAAQESGWSFTGDLGATFIGAPRVSSSHVGCTAPAPVCGIASARVEDERRDLAVEASRMKLYPVVRAGLMYRF